jgi:hypothetical protein
MWPFTWLAQWFSRLDAKLNNISAQLNILIRMEKQMAVDFTAINAEVARQTTVDASIETLLAQVAAALAAIPKSSDPVTQAALDAVVAGIKSNNDAIVASVVANTPAA